MTIGFELAEIPGWTELVEWFGFEPTFHDAEVTAVDFRRRPLPTTVSVHTWRMTSVVDDRGYYVLDRHAVINFIMLNVEVEVFEGWNQQNVLMDISITRQPSPFGIPRTVIHLNSIFGLEARFAAETVVVELIPGKPARLPGGPQWSGPMPPP